MKVEDYCYSEVLSNRDDFYYIAFNEKQHKHIASTGYFDNLSTLALFKILLNLPTQTRDLETYRAKIRWWQQQLSMLNSDANESPCFDDNSNLPYSIHPLIKHLVNYNSAETVSSVALSLLSQLNDYPLLTVTTQKTQLKTLLSTMGRSIAFAITRSLTHSEQSADQNLHELFGRYWLIKHQFGWKLADINVFIEDNNHANNDPYQQQRQHLITLLKEIPNYRYDRNIRIYLRLIGAWLKCNKALNNYQSAIFEPSPVNKLYQYIYCRLF